MSNDKQISYSRAAVSKELEHWTIEDVEAAIHHQFLGSCGMKADKIWEKSSRNIEELTTWHKKEVGYWLTAKTVKRQIKEKPLVTPFNFGSEVLNMGATITIAVEQKKASVEVGVNQTTISCDVIGGFVDPTPISAIDADIKTAKFSPAIVDIVNFCSSFCSMKKGLVTAVEPSVGGSLLGLNRYFKAPESPRQIASLCDNIIKRYTPGVSFEGETISGMAFQHRLYGAFTSMKGGDLQQVINTINENVIGSLRDAGTVGGNRLISVKIDEGRAILGVHPPNPPFPNSVEKIPFKPVPVKVDGVLTPGTATLVQAYTAMRDARSYRGSDRGERAGIARCAYCPINLTPEWAELTYQIAEIKRLPKKDYYLLFDSTAGNKMFNVLMALRLIGYRGKLYAPLSQALINNCKPESEGGNDYIFKDDLKISVLEMDDFNEETDVLIIDKREITSVRSGTYVALMTAQRDQTTRRINILNRLKCPYVLYAPLTDLTKSAVSTVTMHNGIVLYHSGVKFEGESWWYTINTPEDVARMAWIMVMVNICRTHAMIFNKKIVNWLPQLGIKPPMVSVREMRVLGKVDMIYSTVLEEMEATYDTVDLMGKAKEKEEEEQGVPLNVLTDEMNYY